APKPARRRSLLCAVLDSAALSRHGRQRRGPRRRGAFGHRWRMTSQAKPSLPTPPMPPVEQYGPAMSRLALTALRSAVPPNPNTPRIIVYLMPWYRQGAAWFSVGLAIAMATRAGARVEFLLNDLPYPAIHPQELNEVA